MRRFLITVFALLFLPMPAFASPWLLRANEVVIGGRFDYQTASSEFLDDGPEKNFPLRGQFESATFDISGRIGFLDMMELEIAIPLRVTSYTSDPVILLATDNPDNAFDYYQDNVIDLTQSVAGVADIRLASRFQLIRSAFASSFELSLKTPTGYDGPAGTFGENPESIQDFVDNVGTYVSPENVTDDVTLGDGQVDLGAKFLIGWAMPSKTFLRLDLGYLLRLGGAGDQIAGDFRVGQAIGRRVLISAGGRMAYAVQEGEVIGVSVAAQDPDLPATEYGGTDNLLLREVTLDHDALSVGGGVIVRITSDVEASAAYERTIWGRNVAATETVSLGMGVRFDASPE